MSYYSLILILSGLFYVTCDIFHNSVTLWSIDVPDGKLENGHSCQDSLCSLTMFICIDTIESTSDECTQQLYLLGTITTNSNSFTFDHNAKYGDWINPDNFSFDSDNKGFQLKTIIYDANSGSLIDQFVVPVTYDNNSLISYIHPRNGDLPTNLTFSWNNPTMTTTTTVTTILTTTTNSTETTRGTIGITTPTSVSSTTTYYLVSSYSTMKTDEYSETPIHLHTTTDNNISRVLIDLAKENITDSLQAAEALEILNITLKIANGTLSAIDLKHVSETLCHCSVVSDLEDLIFFLYMDCYNQVLAQQSAQLGKAEYLYNSSLLYLECVHQMATNMLNSTFNYNNENVAMSIVNTNCSNVNDQYDYGLSFVQYSNYTVKLQNDTYLDSVESMSTAFSFLPYSVLCLGSALSNSLVRNDFLIYRNQKLFLSLLFIDSSLNETVNQCQVQQLPQTDNVVTVKVLNTTENYTNLVQPVSYGFRQNKFSDSLHSESICAYWILEWHTNGCNLRKGQGDLYICQCSHMTDFSLLVNNSENDPALCNNVLSTLGLVLLILSIICLFITIILKFLGNSRVRARFRFLESLFHHTKIKSVVGDTLLVTLFLFYILFAILSDGKTFDLSNRSCAIAGAVLYTILMATLFFAAFTGLIFFKVYYIVFNHRWLNLFTSKLFIIAVSLGMPGVLTIVLWFSVDDFFWRNDRFCWIRPTYVSLAVILPNAVLLLGDIVLSGLLIKGFIFSGSRAIQSAKGRRKIIFRKIFILLTVQLIMCLPWIFEYFTIGTPRVTVFYYLFTIANGSEGIWLAIIYLYSFYHSIKLQTVREPNTTESYLANNAEKKQNRSGNGLMSQNDKSFSDSQSQIPKRRLTRNS